ncbi:MAG: glutamine-hydrolyzing carbamoyl-phosphate synthase small subunit [Saprospiraceae bacterium]
MLHNPKKSILLLSDGTIFYGKSMGFKGQATGEICFNTGMTGYQEIFTDPSYSGQLMLMTNVHIGNYGCSILEKESSKVQISGLICRNIADHFSRATTETSLEDYLETNQIVCIYDIDTRALVHHVRNKGTMNAIISNDDSDIELLRSKLALVPDMLGLEIASKVSAVSPYELGDSNSPIKIAAIDYGIKSSILQQLTLQNFNIKVFPAETNYTEIEKWNPTAYFLSNGPGDPAAMNYAVKCTSKIIEGGKPIFGICLGHQIIGEALGIRANKMFQGHRGSNHPVKNLLTGRGEITSQNHGFTLSMEDVEKRSSEIKLTHINLNDHSVEGIMHNSKPIFSVQYHPEAGPGPHDSRYLFNRFSDLINRVYGFKNDKVMA